MAPSPTTCACGRVLSVSVMVDGRPTVVGQRLICECARVFDATEVDLPTLARRVDQIERDAACVWPRTSVDEWLKRIEASRPQDHETFEEVMRRLAGLHLEMLRELAYVVGANPPRRTRPEPLRAGDPIPGRHVYECRDRTCPGCMPL